MFPIMGITRVSNVTGLDILGIPVVLSIRPNSRSLASSQGKGQTLMAAKVSAVMESAETYHAERIDASTAWGSFRQMSSEQHCISVHRLPKLPNGRFHDDLPIHWLMGTVWPHGASTMVPFEVVSTDFRVDQPTNSYCFSATTNGLASGNTLAEAVAHGLYEVIERDSLTLWSMKSPRDQEATGIDAASVTCPDCSEMIERFRAAGLDLRIWNMTTDVGIPAFIALAIETKPDGLEIETGSGCHPHKDVALSRALTEVAQGRVTRIAGSRDDLDPALIGLKGRAYRLRRTSLIPRSGQSIDFRAGPSVESDDILLDLDMTVSRLKRIGIDEIVVCDLTRQNFGIPVVKVLVPALKGPAAARRSNPPPEGGRHD